MKKSKITFNHAELYWRDCNKKEYTDAVDILNTLTEKEKAAVKKFCESLCQSTESDSAEFYESR